MINYVIIDDEPAAIEVIRFHLKKMPAMELKASFRDPLKALDYLQNTKVDLVFLDINMPELSGIGLSKLLKNPPLIIFTTAYSEYAIESYELQAVDYLLKPIQFDRLLLAVTKVKQILSPLKAKLLSPNENVSDTEQTIFIKSGSEFHQVPIKSIMYIESDGNYVTFFTIKRAILARYKISEVLKLLPNKLFKRVHRSYIVGVDHIEIVKTHCVVIDGKEIPISSNYREEFLAIISGFGKGDK
jgi:DNA-binding LytR/AlgR family response regulator